MRERLKAEPAEVICKYLFGPFIAEDNVRSFYNMADINLAHVIMLVDQRIIDRESGVCLLKVLGEMRKAGPSCLDVHPEYEDYYFNVEQYVIGKVGGLIGGKMHTARSRNDLGSTLARMNARDSLVKIIDMALQLQSVLLNLAEEHTETVFTGYTHMQPAQPITFAYYLLAVAQALGRDCKRMLDAADRMNFGTLGSCAFAGTSFDVNRDQTAAFLGFDGPMFNAMDAVASKDYLMEIAACFTMLGSTLNRFANDLYIWSTDEFGYIEVDDSLAVCSSIMPQKKNPITFEHVKAKSAHLLGAFVSITTTLKGIPYTHVRDGSSECLHLFWDACYQTEAMLALLTQTIATMKINGDAMYIRVNANYCTITELADELVKTEGLPFRTAHGIVSIIASNSLEKGLTSAEIDVKMLDEAGEAVIGRTFGWTNEKLSRILDARRSVDTRISFGSPSPIQCGAMIKALRDDLAKDNERFSSFGEKIANAKATLQKRILEFFEA